MISTAPFNSHLALRLEDKLWCHSVNVIFSLSDGKVKLPVFVGQLNNMGIEYM